MLEIGSRLGVAPVVGGRHPIWGTRNALLGLGPRCYLEIVGPDEDGPADPPPRPFGIDGLSSPRLDTWVAGSDDLEKTVAEFRQYGVELGQVVARSRVRPDGSQLGWRMTDLFADREGGVIPYFIDWGDTPHPALTAPGGCDLLGLAAEHPNPERVQGALARMGLDLVVTPGPEPRVVALIRSPRGDIELR